MPQTEDSTSTSFDEFIKSSLLSEDQCVYLNHDKSSDLTPAAVLIPLVESSHDKRLSVLLTTRTEHLHHHPGQVSLPGGRMDAQDKNPVHTAIRETSEETGISAEFIEIVGGMDHYPTSTGFMVTPIVGRILPGHSIKPDPFEVDEVFLVPLSFILNPENHQKHTYQVRNQSGTISTGYYYQLNYSDKRIWGVTAAILISFYKRLREKHPLFCELVHQLN